MYLKIEPENYDQESVKDLRKLFDRNVWGCLA